jgi:hypothetical protein
MDRKSWVLRIQEFPQAVDESLFYKQKNDLARFGVDADEACRMSMLQNISRINAVP